MSSQISIKRPITSHSESQYMQLSDIIRHIKEAVTHRVSHRLKVTEAVQIATFLDPSTKDLMCSVPFDQQKNCRLAIQNLHMRNVHVILQLQLRPQYRQQLVLVLRYHIQRQQPAAAAMVTYLHGRLHNCFPRRCVSSRNVKVLMEHKLPTQASK